LRDALILSHYSVVVVVVVDVTVAVSGPGVGDRVAPSL